MVGMVCTLNFLDSSEPRVGRFHVNPDLYAKNPLTKKNSGMRKRMRKCMDDEY